MASNALAFVPDLYMRSLRLCFDPRPRRQWDGIEVCQHGYGAAVIDLRKRDRRQIESFAGQGTQMLTLDRHCRSNRLCIPGDDPLLFFFAPFPDLLVQVIQITCFRQRHHMVPPEVPLFAFHSALFVALCWIAKVTFEAPV
jgi:hypothetical protein